MIQQENWFHSHNHHPIIFVTDIFVSQESRERKKTEIPQVSSTTFRTGKTHFTLWILGRDLTRSYEIPQSVKGTTPIRNSAEKEKYDKLLHYYPLPSFISLSLIKLLLMNA